MMYGFGDFLGRNHHQARIAVQASADADTFRRIPQRQSKLILFLRNCLMLPNRGELGSSEAVDDLVSKLKNII